MRTAWLIYIVEFGTLDFFPWFESSFKNIALPITPLLFEVNTPEAEISMGYVIYFKKEKAISIFSWQREIFIYHLLFTKIVGTLDTLSQ